MLGTLTTTDPVGRHYPIGAESDAHGAVSFRMWAPARRRVSVAIVHDNGTETFELASERNGYFSGIREATAPGTLYWLQVDDAARRFPDPASRYQPHGHEGPSQVIDPMRYRWQDGEWTGVPREDAVLYELHIGTFTHQGTWRAAADALPWLAELGVTVLEIMPVGEFPGRFGWGYDVVHFFAPTRLYGSPDEMRAFIDAAHALGMAVILDVVYNHCSTIGCFLAEFTPNYFSLRHRNDWGHALNFDGDDAQGVREFVLTNADYWIREFHVDGYRLDATQTILDDSPVHIIADITRRARAAAGTRTIYIVGENEPQQAGLLKTVDCGGCGLDALWNDDFHHAARVALTGRSEAYYTDYRGSPQEFVSAAKYGFLYQGQYYTWQKQPRGSPAFDLDPRHFVTFLQNHDQVANSTRGLRLHQLTSPGRYRAATALLLLAPQTPMLFQGQEFAASAPFLYFADNTIENAEVVAHGRREFLEQFPSIKAGGSAVLENPASDETFERCKLDLNERETHRCIATLHRDLLKLRRTDPAFMTSRQNRLDGAVLGREAFVLRFFTRTGDRLLIVNLGRELALSPVPEPLLSPCATGPWRLLWSSEDVVYGGDGMPAVHRERTFHVPAHCAIVLTSAL